MADFATAAVAPTAARWLTKNLTAVSGPALEFHLRICATSDLRRQQSDEGGGHLQAQEDRIFLSYIYMLLDRQNRHASLAMMGNQPVIRVE